MITHYAGLQVPTVSLQGAKQFYCQQLKFPVISESEDEICFQPTDDFTLTCKETEIALHPVHIAFEVPYSEFDAVVSKLHAAGVTFLDWPDGRSIDQFETGKNVYFRDGDGNLLEIIAHSYVKEGILQPHGDLSILYLREVGFPVEDVVAFRELFVRLLHFKLDKVMDNFCFAIGGTAHAVIPSTKRKWIPIAMKALQPTAMVTTFGVSSHAFIKQVQEKLDEAGILGELTAANELIFNLDVYCIHLRVTTFPEDVPVQLNLPLA
ncbi:VOC family protein [Paenibacillus qinlingensis]|uniref:Catechol 2,3-dioxygenase-like lactoylglutathione lyase family enzyme n=1 Tax=Paenibacillus qinlingensis TaxID=1837343 RepID=A0ABU1NR06_9BACL|nr:VOC family protein [Paenibacillus qinlingensis]MDR6549916.1 catechol 2,3-dioxygenase-like lactoylglutathione lyase family enzyme [Paenibacillus qinlingensis]